MDREDELGAGPQLSEEAFAARYRARYEELRLRLEAEPGVRAVTLANRFARMSHPQSAIEVETDGDLTPPRIAPKVGTASVAPDYFDALDTRVLAGRGFDSGDDSDQGVVIVNQSFVDRVLGGRNAVGRRVRYAPPPGRGSDAEPWYQIVGVVPDLAMLAEDSPDGAGMYHPLAQLPAYPVYVSGDVGGDAHLFASRLRTLAESVDPALRLDEILPLDRVGGSLMLELTLTSAIVTGVGALAILLSLAGIYSVLAFRIERRTREIGLRAALGADKLRIIIPMLKPVFIQVGPRHLLRRRHRLPAGRGPVGAGRRPRRDVRGLHARDLHPRVRGADPACATRGAHRGAARGELSRSGVGERRPQHIHGPPPGPPRRASARRVRNMRDFGGRFAHRRFLTLSGRSSTRVPVAAGRQPPCMAAPAGRSPTPDRRS